MADILIGGPDMADILIGGPDMAPDPPTLAGPGMNPGPAR